MAAKIKLTKLRTDLNTLSRGLVSDDPASFILADKVIEYCIENQLDSPYEGKFCPVIATHLTGQAFAGWTSAESRSYIAAGLQAHADEQAAKGALKAAAVTADEDDVPVWKTRPSVAFDRAAHAVLANAFIVAEAGDEPPVVYEIEDHEKKQVRPLIGTAKQQQVVFGRAARPTLHHDGVGVSDKLIDGMVVAFQTSAHRQKPPDLLGQPLDLDWCLHRATVLPREGEFPHIKQFTDRLNDPQAFGAYWWGIYSGHNKGRQILYISDGGMGGKSEIVSKMVTALYGDRISQSYPANKIASDNPHASSAFVGKKLVVAGDNGNPYLLHTAMLKSLSGSDKSFVNAKFQQPYSTHFQCRVIVMSNVDPVIIRAAHNTSRTLWLRLAPLDIPDSQRDPHYADKCVHELPAFLHWARECYAQRASGVNGAFAIRTNQAVQDLVERQIRLSEAQFAVPFDDLFVLDSNGLCSSAEFSKAAKDLRLSDHRAEEFRAWICAMHPDEVELAIDAKRKTGWFLSGVRLKRGSDWPIGDAPTATAAATAAPVTPRPATPATPGQPAQPPSPPRYDGADADDPADPEWDDDNNEDAA